jgi:hypothetical protein
MWLYNEFFIIHKAKPLEKIASTLYAYIHIIKNNKRIYLFIVTENNLLFFWQVFLTTLCMCYTIILYF